MHDNQDFFSQQESNFEENENFINQDGNDDQESEIEEEPEVYGALKCYFYTPKRGDIWGAFCFLFNGTTGEPMEKVFWVTRSLTGSSIDVSVNWKSLNKLIPQMGTYERALGEKLSMLLYDSFSPGARIDICKSEDTSGRLHNISEEIRNAFERSTHCFLDFKMAFERMSKQDLTSAGVLKDGNLAAPEVPTTENLENLMSGALVICQPIIEPVYGKPVSELEPGDLVEVKIQSGVGASGLVQSYLSSSDQESVFPVEVVDKSDPEKTNVILTINDEIKGLITINKDLRLRVVNTEPTKKTSISINMDNIIFFGVFAAAVAVIAIVLKVLFF